MNLSIIIPVYNEERTVRKVIQEVLTIKEVSEVLVVNDGSTDRTEKEIKKVKHPKLKLHNIDHAGKGAALRFAAQHVTGDYILIQDADLEYHPKDIPLLLKPLQEREHVQVVYGSRFLGPHLNLLYWHMIGNKFLNFVVNILFNTTLSDMETCYKLIPTALWKDLKLQSSNFNIEPEITCKILKKKIRIYEVPISYFGRDFHEGKKITWRDGFRALWSIIKYRFS